MKYLYSLLLGLVATPASAIATMPTAFPVAPGLYESKDGVSVEVAPTAYGPILRIVVERPHAAVESPSPLAEPPRVDRVGFFWAPVPGAAFFVQSQFGGRPEREFFGGVLNRLRALEISSVRVVHQALENGQVTWRLGPIEADPADTPVNRLAGALADRMFFAPHAVDPAEPQVIFAREWVHGRVLRFLNGDVTLTFEHAPWPNGPTGRFQTDGREKLVLRLNPKTRKLRAVEFQRDEASITCRNLLLTAGPAAP